MENKIKKLERLIPKLKANKKILPLKVECMEWELRALKAERQLKILNIPHVSFSEERMKGCEHKNTEKVGCYKDVWCLDCGEYVKSGM